MMWPMTWLNKNIATINVILQFLDIYIYIYIGIERMRMFLEIRYSKSRNSPRIVLPVPICV